MEEKRKKTLIQEILKKKKKVTVDLNCFMCDRDDATYLKQLDCDAKDRHTKSKKKQTTKRQLQTGKQFHRFAG